MGKCHRPGFTHGFSLAPNNCRLCAKKLKTTACGQFLLGRLESSIEVLHQPGKPLTAFYDHLVDGDTNAPNYSPNDWWKRNMTGTVTMECLEALIRQDETRGKRAAGALVTLTKINAGNWWDSDSKLLMVALAYDFDYAYMSDEQRDAVRQAIAGAIAGRKTYGSEMPSNWRTYNWMGRGTSSCCQPWPSRASPDTTFPSIRPRMM